MTDIDRAFDMFEALGMSDVSDVAHYIVIPGAPWSKARPRFTRRGFTYTAREDRDAEERTASYIRNSIKEPFTGNVGLGCIFYRPNRQRIDTDNLIKHVCDSANGVAWKDDSQCTAVMGLTELDVDNPRTVLVFGKHESTLRRGSDDTIPCLICGNEIALASRSRNPPPKSCSPKCRRALMGQQSLVEPVPCRQCGKEFRRRTKTQELCSEECRVLNTTAKRRGTGKPFSLCIDCNKQLAHKRAGRCRECWKNSVKAA